MARLFGQFNKLSFEGVKVMALIECSECKAQISDKADKCPKCGNPINIVQAKPVKKKNGCMTLIGGFFLIFVLVYLFGHYGSSENSKTASSQGSTKTEVNNPLKVKVTNYSTSDGYYTVVGYVQNNGKDSYQFVQVEANFYDKKGTLVGNEMTFACSTDFLTPNSQKSFKFMGQDPGNYDRVSVGLKDYQQQ